MLIRRSDDGGKTWSDPKSPTTGVLRQGAYHCAPCRILIANGRIWRSMERYAGKGWGNFAALVMSAPVDANLLDAASWTFSDELPKQPQFAWLEGNLITTRSGELLNILRTNRAGDDKAAIVHVAPNGKQLQYNHERDFINMPGGGVKFTIRHDPKTDRYWSIVSQQTNPKAYRNHLVLASSADLRNWQVERRLQFHADGKYHAWQYVDWLYEGDAIIYVSRTAYDDGLGGAHRGHDANFLTFHRIADFRQRP